MSLALQEVAGSGHTGVQVRGRPTTFEFSDLGVGQSFLKQEPTYNCGLSSLKPMEAIL